MDTLSPNSEVLAAQKSADVLSGEKESMLAIAKPTFVYVDNLLTKSEIRHCGEGPLPASLVQDGGRQLVCNLLCEHDVRTDEKAPP